MKFFSYQSDHAPAPRAHPGSEHVVFAGAPPAPPGHARPVTPPRTRSSIEPSFEPPRPDSDSVQFFEWLCRQRGLQAHRYRDTVVHRRHQPCLRAVRASSSADAKVRAGASPELVDRALNAVLIGVTSFFRDGAPFEALTRELADPRSPLRRRSLEVVSVGCSDGQELYSVAMVLAETGLLHRANLWGIDCRSSAIRAASAGTYAAEAVADLTPARRARWFEARHGLFTVKPQLQARTRWSVADAFDFAEPAAADIVLCRNLAIYLRPETAREFWISLIARLRPGGLLVVGKAERPRVGPALVRVGPCLYRKVEAALS